MRILIIGLAACSASAQPPASSVIDAPAVLPDVTIPDAIAPVVDPAQPGPWQVGVHTTQLTDPSRSRTFHVDVWYPVAAGTTDGSPNTYTLDSPIGPLAKIASPARRDATPAAGSWPLIVFSHGFGGIRFQSYFLTERLASHGFVVVAPDHPGNTLADFAQLGSSDSAAQSAIDRPLDVIFTLDAALAGQLGVAVTVDPARIAATGHSFGGWTCLEVARRDARVRAVFPLAPGFRNGATDDFVADLARPLLLVGGSADHTCAFPENQQDPYMKAVAPKFLVEITGAGHLDFSNLCEVPLAKLFVRDGCDPTKIDPEIVHARANTIATAFALRYVANDPRYAAMLEPGYVDALGNLTYWATP